jgi:membrane protease YdiL (CAAX protease family)
MTAEIARELTAAGFFMLLVLLRLEAERFGTAEYEKPLVKRADAVSWAAWYGIAAVFLVAISLVHPRPRDQLYLMAGRMVDILVTGIPLALLGAGLAFAYARYRYGYLRLPERGAYPRAAVNAIGTAVIDEAAFRGVALGALYSAGVRSGYAIAISALAYVLATRLAAPGRRRFMLVPAFAYGFLGGWATLATGGLGAAIVFHASTSFALFVCTGHAGQTAPLGREPEEIELASRPPGWLVAVVPGGRRDGGERAAHRAEDS